LSTTDNPIRSFDYWAVVPAAGVGKRFGAATPKQYLPLCGRSVIEHTIERLLSHPKIKSVTVAVGRYDGWWDQVPSQGRTRRVDGGAERCHSVLNGLGALLAEGADPQDRVLVHDAVRPCIRGVDIDRLMTTVAEYDGGGVLGLPARDTMKRVDSQGRIEVTESRDRLWHALTPQLFPLKILHDAMHSAISTGRLVTDEAQAMELVGYKPIMVEGHPDNIKITRRDDMDLAALYLTGQAGE